MFEQRKINEYGMMKGIGAHSTTRKRAKDPGQKYQLLLQPVLMRGISTGCNTSRYS